MTTTIATTSTIKGFAVPLDENDSPVEADTPPVADDLIVRVNGSTVGTGTKAVGAWANGYFFSFAPASPFNASDVITIQFVLMFDAEPRFYVEQWTAVSLPSGGGETIELTVNNPAPINLTVDG